MAPVSARRRSPAVADGRGKLSRDQVVEAAVELADREGLDALTLRKLAVALGVTPMALYWHVEDKQALLDALGERMFASVELPEPVDGWFEDLCAVCRAIVAELHRHPGVAPLAVTTVLTSEAGVRVAERVLSRLCNAGFSDRDVADIGAYLLRAIVVLVTALPGEMPCSDEDAERMQRKHAHLANLPVDRYPIVARLAGELTECGDPEALLASGVDVLMLGIKGFAERVTSTGG